jgi:thioredoxin-related protein
VKAFILLLFSLIFLSINSAHSSAVKKLPTIKSDISDINGLKFKWGSEKNGFLIVFISEHCPYDQDWRKKIISHLNWAKQNQFFTVIINSSSSQVFTENKKENLLKVSKNFTAHHFVIDDQQQLARLFGVTRTPTAIVYNSNKTRIYFGMIDDQPNPNFTIKKNYLIDVLQQSAAGKESKFRYSDPIGCKIKGDGK